MKYAPARAHTGCPVAAGGVLLQLVLPRRAVAPDAGLIAHWNSATGSKLGCSQGWDSFETTW